MEPVRPCVGNNGLLNALATLVMKINKKSLLGIPIAYTDLGMVERLNLRFNSIESKD